jgi:hypothetical protein
VPRKQEGNSMGKTALELIAEELQGVAPSASDVARAAALVGPLNQKVREAADARLRFEDEPGGYIGFLRGEAER